ncbi:MAG: HEAT repeat domain-containing protein [Candidatus Lokiarchaeota archaeon]|nr:HEAT repeat domain-containing protein [Candidatus Lokiarchaeota archaeon]
MTWHEQNVKYNALIKQLFHDENWQKRAEVARELGIMEEGRAVNLLCRALRSEKDHIVINRIIEALGRIRDGRATLRIVEKLLEELDKSENDKFRIIYILEALKRIKDKRALEYIGIFLKSSDEKLKTLTQEIFDIIEPDWRNIIEKERKEKTIQEIFRFKI